MNVTGHAPSESGWKLEDFRMPLLQRKVSKILVVDSTNVELSEALMCFFAVDFEITLQID